MKSLIIAAIISVTLLTAGTPAPAQQKDDRPYRPPRDRGMYGSGPGDIRPRAPKIEKEEAPVTSAMDEQWKWLLGATLVGFVGYTVWRLLKEANRVSHRKRQPWEIE